MDSFLSEEGLQVKGKKAYSNLNLTIEGIGNDAAISGFGLLLRNAGNVELRNFAVMLCMDDCVSIDTGNCNLWVHNMDFFYGKTGGDSDQAKGDGTVDLKGASTYLTISENHFWDSGKSSLCGMKSDCYTDYYVTYSKNWFDHSDSRHPRIRGGNIHVYNNYYDGNAKYGVGVTTGGSAFVENNYFRNCKDPMLISQQGTDAKGTGTFSGEDGGYIKEYGNILVGTYYFIPGEDAYCATSRDEKVPDTYVATAVNDGVRYSNFDTDSSIMYSYTPIEAKDVPTYVVSNAGRLNHGDFNWDFENLTEDTNYAVISELKTALQNYKSNLVSVGGTVTTTSTSTTPCSLIGTDGNTVSYQPEEKLTSLKLPTETDEDGNKATGGTGGQTSYDLYVKASDLDGSVVSGTQEVKGTSGSVTVIASTDKPVTLDKSKGIMLGGSGSKTVRTIKFTAEKKGTFYISGASTSSDVRTLAIVNEDGTEVATVTTDTTGKLTLDAGTYYVYSKNKGINVSLIAMVYDDNGDNGDAGEDNGDDEPTLPYAYGDASGDGSLTANDAAVILQKVLDSKFVMGIEEKVTDEATVKTIVDVDGNGTITSNDAAVVLQKVLDNSYTMPCEK
jgi:pectate lyase